MTVVARREVIFRNAPLRRLRMGSLATEVHSINWPAVGEDDLNKGAATVTFAAFAGLASLQFNCDEAPD